MAPRRCDLAALVVGVLVLSIFSTWPLALHMGSALPGDLGDPLLNAWILGWDADRLRHGLSGLWNAPILYPNTLTLAFSEHLLGIALPVAPIVWLTGNPVLAYNVAFVLTYVLAATGMFVLARSITGRTDAAILAGLAFAFGPPRTDQISHLQVLASGWMPLCLWGLHRYFVSFSRRALAIFALAFVWQAYSNGYFLYFLSMPVVVVLIFECTARWKTLKPRLGRTLLELSAAGAAMLIAIAPIASVYLDVRAIYGLRRSYSDLVNFAAHVESYGRAAEPVRLWSRWLATDLAPERQLFPGLTVLALAALAFWTRHSRSQPEPPPRPEHPTHVYVWCYATIVFCAFVLSLGAEPSGWGVRVLPFSPYLGLAQIVPGLDGLRAPARFSVVVMLGLSVLAAIGYGKGVRPLFAILVIAIVAEGWSAPIRLAPFDARGREAERPVYTWLAGKPRAGVLELPVKEWDIAPTLTYQYATLFHGQQIINGYSGYGSTLQGWLGGSATPLNELGQIDAAIDALQHAGIRYVVVHRADYPNRAFAEDTVARLRGLGRPIAEIKDFGETIAFQLSDERTFPARPLADGARPLPSSELRATASDGSDRLGAAFDRDPDSRWFTGRAQRGDEWIRIDLARPTRIAGVRLRMSERSLGDYPRGLRIEAIGEDGQASEVRSSPVLAEFAEGLLRNGDYPSIDIALPAGTPSTAIVLRQTGTTRTWYWSIHELEVLAE